MQEYGTSDDVQGSYTLPLEKSRPQCLVRDSTQAINPDVPAQPNEGLQSEHAPRRYVHEHRETKR